MTTIIHVHQQVIASNRKHGRNDPPLTIKTYASKSRHAKPLSAKRAHEVTIAGPARIVHSPHDPLPCGARVWIETESEVICGKESREVAERQQACGVCEGQCPQAGDREGRP